MKHAPKRIIESLVIVSLIGGLYATSINDIKAQEMEAVNETELDYEFDSPFAGSTKMMMDILEESSNKISTAESEASIVGISLADCEITEEGEIIVPEPFEPYDIYVNSGYLNVRSGPGQEYDVIGKLHINDLVTVVGEAGDVWMEIEYNDGIGYISSEYTQDTLPEEDTYNSDWNGPVLNKHSGVCYGPSGKETYYNLNMSKVIYYMQCLGYYDYYWVRSDGAKMYGNYVMVAANLSKYPKGTLVETSLGTGIVVDTGDFTKNGSGVEFDIATTW